MTDKKIKVLVVDDTLIFRSYIQQALSQIDFIEVVGVAANGKIALHKMENDSIDLCILDFEMPEMNGLETLKQMALKNIKTKVLMFSSLNLEAVDKTMEALRLGAVDFVMKPIADNSGLSPIEKIKNVLLPKITGLFKISSFQNKIQSKNDYMWNTFTPDILVIASSTGGPVALEEYFSYLKEELPFPILITQHMPPLFTTSLAEKIGRLSGKISKEAVQGEELVANRIYVAPGGFHMKIAGTKNKPMILLDQGEMRNYVRPCADYLFESATTVFGRNTLGIVFTGMGRDGADGSAMIKKNNGAVLIQSESSCVVFGMPGAVYTEGNYEYQGNILDLAQKTLNIAKIRRNYGK